MNAFEKRNRRNIERMARDSALVRSAKAWFYTSLRYEYTHHFTWLGLPIIQLPQDILAMQELVWADKPDLIIETGVARGGSIVFYASLLELIGHGKAVGIDIDIRRHNRIAIERHPLSKRITLIEGSSTDPAVVRRVHTMARRAQRPMVVLDSNHSHEHVLTELNIYANLVKPGGHLVVFDTVIDSLHADLCRNRPWGKGNSPATAVRAFLKANPNFEPDTELEKKLLVTAAPGGFLKRLR